MFKYNIKQVLQSKLAKSSLIYTTDTILQIFVQAAYAILISRYLGPSSYGIFASITATTIIVSVFSSWGSDQILIKNVAVNKDQFNSNFGSSLLLTMLTYPILLAILLYALTSILPKSEVTLLTLILFITTDLIFTKLIFISKNCFLVFEKPINQLVINVFTALVKLIFLLLALYLSTDFNLNIWAFWYFSSSLLSTVFSIGYVIKHLGYPIFNQLKSEFNLGFQFCIEQASLAILKDIDKPIVVALLGTEQGGYYAAAFRMVDAASAPARGILNAAYVRYFKFSLKNQKSGIDFSLRILPWLSLITLTMGVVLFLFAWTIPLILGDKYLPSVNIVQQLCLYPFLIGLLGTGVDLLRGIGLQLTRTYIMIFSSLITAPILYLYIKWLNYQGVAFAKIFVLFLTVLIVWFFIYRVKSKRVIEE